MSTYSVSSRFAPKKTLTWAELSQFKDGIPNLTQTTNGVTTTCPSCLDVEQDTGDIVEINVKCSGTSTKELFTSAKANSDTNGTPTYSCFISDVFLLSRDYTYEMTLSLNLNNKIPFAQREDGIIVRARLFTYDENGTRSYTNNLKLTPIINGTADTSKAADNLTIKKGDLWGNWATDQVSLATASIKIDTAYISGTIASSWHSVHNIALYIQGN